MKSVSVMLVLGENRHLENVPGPDAEWFAGPKKDLEDPTLHVAELKQHQSAPNRKLNQLGAIHCFLT